MQASQRKSNISPQNRSPRARNSQPARNLNNNNYSRNKKASQSSNLNKAKKPQIKYVQDVSRKKIPFSVYILTFLGFALGVVTLISGANVTLQRIQNTQLETQLADILNTNNALLIELSGDLDMLDIDYLARTSLNMAEPLLHQIEHIVLPPVRTPEIDFTLLPQYEPHFFDGFASFAARFLVFLIGDR
ncbi:MAG: hypothetical protein FWF50_03385 [Defluviitaleaceae bacterium]|nr:hypothetical protein [Defluviitaleaceae bacterium]